MFYYNGRHVIVISRAWELGRFFKFKITLNSFRKYQESLSILRGFLISYKNYEQKTPNAGLNLNKNLKESLKQTKQTNKPWRYK